MKRLLIFAVLSLFLLGADPSGCQGQNQPAPPGAGGQPLPLPPGRKFACTTYPEPPMSTLLGTKPAVMGVTWSKCDPKPQSHHITLALQHKEGTNWPQRGATTCEDIPWALHSKTCKLIITPCIPGMWRTKVWVHGVGPEPDLKIYNFEDKDPPEAKVRC